MIERNEKRERETGRTIGGLNYLVLILLLPDADVRDRKDYAVAD